MAYNENIDEFLLKHSKKQYKARSSSQTSRISSGISRRNAHTIDHSLYDNTNQKIHDQYLTSIYKPIHEAVEQYEETYYGQIGKPKKPSKLKQSQTQLASTPLLPHTLPRNVSECRLITSNGSSGMTTLSGNRRINEDGLRMLRNNLNIKEKEMKATILENRIRRLEHEEERALKNKRMAEKKAEQMMLARQRHHTDLMTKLKRYEDTNRDLETKRRENVLRNH